MRLIWVFTVVLVLFVIDCLANPTFRDGYGGHDVRKGGSQERKQKGEPFAGGKKQGFHQGIGRCNGSHEGGQRGGSREGKQHGQSYDGSREGKKQSGSREGRHPGGSSVGGHKSCEDGRRKGGAFERYHMYNKRFRPTPPPPCTTRRTTQAPRTRTTACTTIPRDSD